MITISTLANGLTVIVEEIPHVESVAYSLQIPGGLVHDPANRVGLSLLLVELTSRGAGGLNSRELSEAFDGDGIRHTEDAHGERLIYRGSCLAEKTERAIELLSFMVLKPEFPEVEIDPIRSLLLQEIQALGDNPSHRAMEEMGARYYPDPYSRFSCGEKEGIEAVKISDLKAEWKRLYHPKGSVLSVAGKCSTAQINQLAQRYFGDWDGAGLVRPEIKSIKPPGTFHVHDDSAQTQIVLSYPSVSSLDSQFYAAKVAGSILSGGFSGRLFIEVREKRGLCYSVWASHSSDQQLGRFVGYAGTTPDRAAETLDVMVRELKRLQGTVTEDELTRAKAHILSSLIISEESTGSRASGNASDWWIRKDVRSLDFVKQAILAVKAKDIDALWEAFPPEPMHVLSLGNKPLQVSAGAKI